MLGFGEKGLATPQFLLGLLALGDFPLELIVGCGELSGSLLDPLLKLVGEPLLCAQQPSLLQPDGRLVRRDAQDKPLGLCREVRSLRSCHDDPDFTLKPQEQRRDSDAVIAGRIARRRCPFLEVGSQPVIEHSADLLWPGRQFLRWSESGGLQSRLAGRIAYPYVNEIQPEHAQEHVEQGANDKRGVAAGPDRRKR